MKLFLFRETQTWALLIGIVWASIWVLTDLSIA
ncbi:unnamed protein product, partial [marine sediment metagenome]